MVALDYPDLTWGFDRRLDEGDTFGFKVGPHLVDDVRRHFIETQVARGADVDEITHCADMSPYLRCSLVKVAAEKCVKGSAMSSTGLECINIVST